MDVVPPPVDLDPWEALRDLPLQVDEVELEPRSADAGTMLRRTTIVHLRGGGAEGLGEDVSYGEEEQLAWLDWAGLPDVRGTWTVGGLSSFLGAQDLFPQPPSQASWRLYRRWAMESAAVDLALRQAGRPLADVLGVEPRPLRFVSSRGVGEPPDLGRLEAQRVLLPDLGFKLDIGPGWDEDLVAALAELGGVAVVDLKGRYSGTVVDTPADPVVYERVARLLPDALLEDPSGDPEALEALGADGRRRVTWDAPLHDLGDLADQPVDAGTLNLKPSRIGSWRELGRLYRHCAEHGVGAYGGGQWELGVGRGQAQLLAALVHPAGPNDLAPGAFNAVELAAELPSSPLALRPAATGFRLADDE